MQYRIDRRHFMHSALALVCAAGARPLRAAQARVLFAFALSNAVAPVMASVLKAMRGRYQPDLGLDITSMPGNSGAVAMQAVMQSVPDGSTVLLAPSSLVTLQPHVKKLPGIDPVADFIPVAAMSQFTAALVVGPAVPPEVRQATDYVEWVREHPMMANYGVAALGAAMHFLGVSLARSSELSLKPVPYKSVISLVEDMRSGSVPMSFLPLSIAREAVRGGSMRMLAVTSEQRWPGHPELPTLLELGLVDVPVAESFGFFMPARTPASKVQMLTDAVQHAAQSEAVLAAIAQAGMRPVPAPLRSYAAALEQERSVWGDVVRKQRFSVES